MIIDPSRIRQKEHVGSVLLGQASDGLDLLETGEIIVIADGVNSFLDFVTEKFPNKARAGSSEDNDHDDFNAFDSYQEALDTFRNKPSSLVVYDPAEINPTSYEEGGNDVDYDVTGDFLDIGRFVEGIPESVGSMHNGKARDRKVRILVDNCHSWITSSKDIIHRSERIIRLTDALEQANVRTEIVVVDSGTCSHVEITVKRFDEPLSLEDVAVATHPEFFRRMGFRIIEHSNTFKYGYGSAMNMRRHFDKLRSAINDEITVYVYGSPDSKTSTDKAFNEVEKLLEDELSLFQPENNLFIVAESHAEGKGF